MILTNSNEIKSTNKASLANLLENVFIQLNNYNFFNKDYLNNIIQNIKSNNLNYVSNKSIHNPIHNITSYNIPFINETKILIHVIYNPLTNTYFFEIPNILNNDLNYKQASIAFIHQNDMTIIGKLLSQYGEEIPFTINKNNIQLNKAFYTIEETYPFLNNLIDYKIIQKEVISILNPTLWVNWPEDYLLNSKENNKWTVYPLMAFGKWSINNIKKCSKTYEMLKYIPGLVNAGFSRFSPGTLLHPHQGYANLSNYILRCHLGIIVPRMSNLYCDNKKEKQEEGKWIIFDDSKEHYADNLGDSDRIVLLLDIKRPSNVEIGKSLVNDTSELKSFMNEFNSN